MQPYVSTPLIHIGYHKTGSSWLQSGLFQDSTVGFGNPIIDRTLSKLFVIPHPFDFDVEKCHRVLDPQIAKSCEENRVPVLTSEVLSGRLFIGGYDASMIADRLAKVLPNARILIVVREQKDIIYSLYNLYVKFGGGLSLPNYLKLPRTAVAPFDRHQFRYDKMVQCYGERFGHEKVLALPFELLKESPQQFVSSITDFCGLSIPDDWAAAHSRHINPSMTPLQLHSTRLFNLTQGAGSVTHLTRGLEKSSQARFKSPRKLIRTIERYMPDSVNKSMKNRMKRTIAAFVGDYYREGNAEASRLTGLDLKSYGYDVPDTEHSHNAT